MRPEANDALARSRVSELIRRLEGLERLGDLTGDGYLWLQDLKRTRDARTTGGAP